jgi:hypothetical protein
MGGNARGEISTRSSPFSSASRNASCVGKDPELLLVGNDTDLGNANPVIDAKALLRAAAVETSSRRSGVHVVTSLVVMCLRILLR